MTSRRAPPACLACQAKRALVKQRCPAAAKRRRLVSVALVAPGDGIEYAGPVAQVSEVEIAGRESERAGATSRVPDRSWNAGTELDGLHDALRGLETLWREKDRRIRVLQTLSNPWPRSMQSRVHRAKKDMPASKLRLPEASAAPLPHDVFRRALANAHGEKQIRHVFRAQLLRCETPSDIRRVVAAGLVHNRTTQMHVAALHEPIMRALYRCRNNVDDRAVLDTISGLYSRFKIYDITFDPQFIMLGLKFAARTRSLKGMKKYLKALRESKIKMSSNVFRAIIAKFSIGHRGLGEIRNGRWKRHELLQVCTGFHDCAHLPPDQQYHLGIWLDRSDWQYLHGWIAVLARCRAADAVWQEWELWKKSPARMKPKNLKSLCPLMTTKTRGDYWFLEQMTYSGGLKEAWQILEETGIDYRTLKDRIKLRLLEGLEHATVWGDDIRDGLLDKYDVDLVKIEKALGIQWVPAESGDDGEGQHVPVDDQVDVLERLGAADWKFEEDYGYPIDSEHVMPQHEQRLHDAVEEDLR